MGDLPLGNADATESLGLLIQHAREAIVHILRVSWIRIRGSSMPQSSNLGFFEETFTQRGTFFLDFEPGLT